MKFDLNEIKEIALAKENENDLFRQYLSNCGEAAVDERVHALNEKITSQIDCTKCGNCCRSLMINVDKEDASRLSDHLQLSEAVFLEKYVEVSASGSLAIMNTIPCHFLEDNKCQVYTARPKECREFPGLHQAGFVKRSFTYFMHYGRCPIIFHVIEELKKELKFETVVPLHRM